MGDLFDFGGFEPHGLVGGSPVTQVFAEMLRDEVVAFEGPVATAPGTLAAADAPAAMSVAVFSFDAFESPAPLEASTSLDAAKDVAPLFARFDWPDQRAFNFENDDAFVAPKRFVGRVMASWL